MAENEIAVKPIRKGSINIDRIKSLKDVRMMFGLLNIVTNDQHPKFAELEEMGFINIEEEVVDIKKNEE